MKRLIFVSCALLMFLCSSHLFAQGASYKISDREKLSKGSETIETELDFFWGKFISPADKTTAPDLQVSVPGEWNKYDLQEEAKAIAKKGYGSGTYRLTITNLKPQTEYAFPVFEVFYTAGKIYADNNLIYQCGQAAENWEETNQSKNTILINKTNEFESWDKWKALNKKGMDCKVELHRDGNKIITITENGGIIIRTITTIKTDTPEVYAALTGDQVAITNIKIL